MGKWFWLVTRAAQVIEALSAMGREAFETTIAAGQATGAASTETT